MHNSSSNQPEHYSNHLAML